MIAIAVDDEVLMLGALAAAIKASPDISEVSQFSGCDEALDFVKENPVDVAILTLPRSQAVKVANDLAKWGVKGMWNFSHVDLQVPEDVLVENVHLTDSLMTLLYKINEMYYSGEDMHEANLKDGLPVKPIVDTEEE